MPRCQLEPCRRGEKKTSSSSAVPVDGLERAPAIGRPGTGTVAVVEQVEMAAVAESNVWTPRCRRHEDHVEEREEEEQQQRRASRRPGIDVLRTCGKSRNEYAARGPSVGGRGSSSMSVRA